MQVDGILFFHMGGTYTPGTSPNVLWLPPGEIEKVLGWKPPEHVLPVPKKVLGKPAPAATTSTSTSAGAASTSGSTDTAASSTATATTEKAADDSTKEVASEKAPVASGAS